MFFNFSDKFTIHDDSTVLKLLGLQDIERVWSGCACVLRSCICCVHLRACARVCACACVFFLLMCVCACVRACACEGVCLGVLCRGGGTHAVHAPAQGDEDEIMDIIGSENATFLLAQATS